MKPPKLGFAPVIQGLPAKGGKQARLQSKMRKLTSGGTATPTGKNLTKYNKAVTKNRAIDDSRSTKAGYGTVSQAAENNARPNVKFPTGLHNIVQASKQFGFGRK
jgi:hypothetical protein